MAGKPPADPLVESLMQLAVSAAPLIERARAAGLFRQGRDAAASTTVAPAAPPQPADDFATQKAVLQDIIVQQAVKIAALEAELAKLKGEAAATRPS